MRKAIGRKIEAVGFGFLAIVGEEDRIKVGINLIKQFKKGNFINMKKSRIFLIAAVFASMFLLSLKKIKYQILKPLHLPKTIQLPKVNLHLHLIWAMMWLPRTAD